MCANRRHPHSIQSPQSTPTEFRTLTTWPAKLSRPTSPRLPSSHPPIRKIRIIRVEPGNVAVESNDLSASAISTQSPPKIIPNKYETLPLSPFRRVLQYPDSKPEIGGDPCPHHSQNPSHASPRTPPVRAPAASSCHTAYGPKYYINHNPARVPPKHFGVLAGNIDLH
jgi:hypothetical protein